MTRYRSWHTRLRRVEDRLPDPNAVDVRKLTRAIITNPAALAAAGRLEDAISAAG